jgi:hypothetical protein
MRSAVDSGEVPSVEVMKLLVVESLVVVGQAGHRLTLFLVGLMGSCIKTQKYNFHVTSQFAPLYYLVTL